MVLYLSPLELVARVHLGKEVEQWLGHSETADYAVIKWLYIAKKIQNQYTVSYMESFDEGDEEWHNVAEFSLLDPDEEVTNSFTSVEEAVAFAVQTYGASAERFVPGGMLPTEYASYWHSKNQ
ncbi:hypothetical protein A0257_16360 [Hymenobacter psoromatis]|nr:hypothetical protein A0257_16360 [Hymenobacter psoromatis]